MKRIYKRLLSLLLAIVLTIGVVGTQFPALAAEIFKDVTFNPGDSNIVVHFKFDLTQRVDIEFKVDGVSRGYLARDYVIPGNGDLQPRNPEVDSTGLTPPRTVNESILPNVTLSRREVAVAAGETETHVFLEWDCRYDGKPVIGTDQSKSGCEMEIVLHPLGYPEKNIWPVADDPDTDENEYVRGENWTWTNRPEWVVGIKIYVDYMMMLTDPEKGWVVISGSASDTCIQMMDELYMAGNRELLSAFSEHVITNGIPGFVAEPINVIDGNFVFTYADLKLEGGIPLTFLRAYNSKYLTGSLGQGFTHGYEYSLTIDRGIIHVLLPGGEEARFLAQQGGYRSLPGQDYTIADNGGGYRMTHRDGASFDFNAQGQLTEARNPNGVTVAALSYANGNLSAIHGVAGDYALSWENGHIASVTDSASRTVRYGYTGDNLTSVTNADGDTLRYTYDANGYLTTCSDFDEDIYLTNTYDAKGRVLHQVYVTADVPVEYTIAYDDDNRKNTFTDVTGWTTVYKYDEYRNIISATDANGTRVNDYSASRITNDKDKLGHSESYARDSQDRITQITSPDGNVVSLTYASGTLIDTVTYIDGSTEKYTYDVKGNVTDYKDRNGGWTRYTYTAAGFLETVTDAQGNVTAYRYDGNGRQQSVTDAEGGTVSYEYDGAGRITATTDPLNHRTTYAYSPGGKLLSQTDALGHATAYTYNKNGFTLTTTDALGGVTSTEYSANGYPLSETDAEGNVSTYTYDDNALLSVVTDPEGNETKYEYDDESRLVKTIDAAGGETRYVYDVLGRQEKVIDALGGETSYTYDEMGRVKTVTDALGNTTTHTYNKLGRTTKVTDALGNDISYSYDFNGNLLATTDANGISTSSEYNAVNWVTKNIDGEGFETSYTYDRVGRVLTVTDALGNVSVRYTYDKAGNMLTQTDAEGNMTSFEYDALNRQVKLINADNSTTRTVYDALGRVVESYDERNGRTKYTYDRNGNVLTTTDPLNHTITNEYNGSNQYVRTTYPDGGVASMAYGKLGRIASSTDQRGFTTSYTYDALGRVSTMISPDGVVTTYTYDAAGNVLATARDGHLVSKNTYDALYRLVANEDGLGNADAYTYDRARNVKTYTDREGHVTQYVYDKNYKKTKTIDALNGTTETAYDALGRALSVTDAEGNATSYAYDKDGNILTTTDALGAPVTNAYNNRGWVSSTQDKLGAMTVYTYSATGQVLTETDAKSKVTTYEYDLNGNLTQKVNRMGEKTQYSYDAMNRQIKEVNHLNHSFVSEYDKTGNRTAYIDGNKNRAEYTYDGAGRLLSQKDAEGRVTAYTYNYLGKIAAFTAPGGGGQTGTTAYTYDEAGNLIKETSPLGYETVYTYDKMGHVLTKTDANHIETVHEYDALYRLTKRTDADGVASFTYDGAGHMLTATDSTGTVSMTYDAGYNVVNVNEKGQNTAYSYNPAGQRLTVTYPDGSAVTNTYDILGRVTALTDYDGTGIHYTRDAEGRVTKEEHSDGSTTEYAYNNAGLLVEQKEVAPNNATRRKIVYGYDDDNNLTSEDRSGVDVTKRDEYVRYTYDKAGQLTGTVIAGVTTAYAYDAAGNLLSDGTYTYTYDKQNRLITKTGVAGKTTYTYDDVGNLIQSVGRDALGAPVTYTYTYNAENRLVKGERSDGQQSAYTYNALGVRIQNVQVRKNQNAGYASADLHDGSDGVDYGDYLKDGRADWQRTYETEVGTTVQNDFETVTKKYVVDYLSLANRDIMVTEEGSWVQRFVYDETGARVSAEFDYAEGTRRGEGGENFASDIAAGDVQKVWYRGNYLGSSLIAVGSDGAVISHTIYDPWGNPLTPTYPDANYSGIDNRNNYTGYSWDAVLGLYYAQARFYSAENHRFTQQDSAKDGANWYVYCGNEPTGNVDPSGMVGYDLLNTIAMIYAAGSQTQYDTQKLFFEIAAYGLVGYAMGNTPLVMHQLAQCIAAGALFRKGYNFKLEQYLYDKAAKKTVRADLIYWNRHQLKSQTSNYIIEIKNNWSLTGSATEMAKARGQISYYYSLFCSNRASAGVGYGAIPTGTSVGNHQVRLLETEKFILYMKLTDHTGGLVGYSLYVSFKDQQYARKIGLKSGELTNYSNIKQLVMPRVTDYQIATRSQAYQKLYKEFGFNPVYTSTAQINHLSNMRATCYVIGGAAAVGLVTSVSVVALPEVIAWASVSTGVTAGTFAVTTGGATTYIIYISPKVVEFLGKAA